MIDVLEKAGCEDIATVYIARNTQGKYLEFVESVQPPISRSKKWVLIVSTLYGCPAGCGFCDAGGYFDGKVSAGEMLAQIDYMIHRRGFGPYIPVKKFKIQFARMGDPAFNSEVLQVLELLPDRYQAPGLMPCISTIAPAGCEEFFQGLLAIKQALYPDRFQLQFSLHSTEPEQRKTLVPVQTWDFNRIAEYGRLFRSRTSRKITLNFAIDKHNRVDPAYLAETFSPGDFMIKLTPVNPTVNAVRNGLHTPFQPERLQILAENLRREGFDVVVSIGELEENRIGSNCGQYVTRFRETDQSMTSGYTYSFENIMQP
jgi:23S rRNA (adenine2503-C2)-methyltransferase